MKFTIAFAVLLLSGQIAEAQNIFRVAVKDSATKELLTGVTVFLKSSPATGAVTDAQGIAVLEGLNSGTDTVGFSYVGYKKKELPVSIPDTSLTVIFLSADQTNLGEVIFVASTRANERLETSATKVEVLGEEELNEESTLKPGNVASLLGDLSGVQIQQSSAVSGNSNVRIQGLDGRYTQMLRDGMPLFEGFSGGFGVLSIPPLDLKQLELIKGSSSTLYGGGAIAGLVNFISKKPGFDPDASFVLNASTLREANLNAYYSQRWNKIGFTFFGGQTLQKEVDVDGDGLSDVPRVSSTLIHPTLFFYPSEKSSVSVGWSGSFEKRKGGDMLAVKDEGSAAHPYFEKNDLKRNTLTLLSDFKLRNHLTASVKGIFSNFDRSITTNTYYFDGSQQNYFAEASLVAALNKNTLVGGLNFVGDKFCPSDATPAMVGTIENKVFGLFLQDTWRPLSKTKVEAGVRLDHHDKYGWFALPRLAIIQQLSANWYTRGGFGLGYKSPNPLTPQNKDYDIYSIHPISPLAVPERSFGANIEAGYHRAFDEEHRITINQAFFLTQINDPYVGFELSDGTLAFQNQNEPIITKGFDTYVQAKLEEWEIYLGYTFTDATRKYLSTDQYVPLTPRNRAAATITYEIEGKWRFGAEASYNGPQYRDGDTKTPDYFFLAAMVEWKYSKRLSIVLNCENLLDERQSRYEKIYSGDITAPDYKPLWAPIDGRVLNLALRVQPFAK